MPNYNKDIIEKAAIDTSSVTHGLLQPYQAKKFLQQTFEATPLMSMIRHEIRAEKSGEIDKIGIGKRLLRAKTENTDDGYRAGVSFGQVQYQTGAVRLPWEITEETLRQNIEGEGLEAVVEKLMTTQVGVDSEDLIINGDTATPSSDPDYDFLKLNDGLIKLFQGSDGHAYDNTGKSFDLEMFVKALQQVPNKFNTGKLKWLMSPHRKQLWELYLHQQVITHGGIVTESMYKAPAGVEIVTVPNMPTDKILLTDPKNIVEVNTYNMKIRKDAASKDAIMLDKRFYVVHFDLDVIVEEMDATAIITNIA